MNLVEIMRSVLPTPLSSPSPRGPSKDRRCRMASQTVGWFVLIGLVCLCVGWPAWADHASSGGDFAVVGNAYFGEAFSLEGGDFSVSGSIGPAMLPLELSDGTRLRISRMDTQIFLDWSDGPMRFRLQQTGQVPDGEWTDVPGGTESPVVLPMTSEVQFFRLIER